MKDVELITLLVTNYNDLLKCNDNLKFKITYKRQVDEIRIFVSAIIYFWLTFYCLVDRMNEHRYIYTCTRDPSDADCTGICLRNCFSYIPEFNIELRNIGKTNSKTSACG